MPVPPLAKSYAGGIDPCNRVVFASLTQVSRQCVLEIKNAMKAEGFTVKGSSTGAAAAMDGADRWTVVGDIGTRGANATSPQAWIVLEHAGQGGAEIMMANQGSADDHWKISVSTGGLWIAAGTVTHQPTATDETPVHPAGELVGPTTSSDRLWSTIISTDGAICHILIARQGLWMRHMFFGMVSSTVGAGVTFSPAFVAFSKGNGGLQIVRSQYTQAVTNTGFRANPGAATNGTFQFSTEGYAGLEGPARVTFAPELQETDFIAWPTGLWSETATIRGKVGNMIDMWFGLESAADGSRYPNDGSGQFIAAGGRSVLPWDGSAVTMT